jgi:acetyl esterase/lipase
MLFIACLVLAAAIAVAFAASEGEPVRTVSRNVIYAETDGVGLLMDVFTPLGADRPGAGRGVVVTTSGGWTSDRGMVEAYENAGFFDALCERGFTAFAVRPGSLTAFTVEQMVAHMKTGVRYVRAHASEYGVAPEWLGIAGVSAGGHLSCLTAMRADPGDPEAEDPLLRFDTALQAVAAFCPPTDFLDWNGERFGLDLLEWKLAFRGGLAGQTEEQKEEAARAVSPVSYVRPGLPPFFLVHGDADTLVPVQQSEKLARALREAGVPAELIIIPGGAHSWEDLKGSMGAMADWLVSHLPRSRS